MILNFKNWIIFESKEETSCVIAEFEDSSDFVSWSEKNIKQRELFQPKGLEKESHVTVACGLQTSNPEDVKEIVKKQNQFNIILGKVTRFNKNPNFDVLKIEVNSKDLFNLNKIITKIPNIKKYDYEPHVTLAYIKKGTCENLLDNTYFEGTKIKIKNITFSDANKNKVKIELNKI